MGDEWFDLNRAVDLYSQGIQPQTDLEREHTRMLWSVVEEAVSQGKRDVEYAVPHSLNGHPPFVPYEMMLFLLQVCKRARFKAKIVDLRNTVIAVWGWAEEWDKQNRERRIHILRDEENESTHRTVQGASSLPEKLKLLVDRQRARSGR